MVHPLRYVSFQPVLHNWCNKGCGICYQVLWDNVYKRTLAANERISHVVAAAGFFSYCVVLYHMSDTI